MNLFNSLFLKSYKSWKNIRDSFLVRRSLFISLKGTNVPVLIYLTEIYKNDVLKLRN